jgi:uncharacterized protein DUF6264
MARVPAERGSSQPDPALSTADAESAAPIRPVRPQYGEYATPEEVAEARGPLPVEPTDPVSRLAAPIASPVSERAAKAPGAASHPRQGNNMFTVLLLVFGIWVTVTSIPSYLDFGAVLSQGFEILGYGTVNFGAIAHTAGIVLLVISLLILIAAVGVSFRLMRDGRRSIWVPLVAAALNQLATLIVMAVIVADTPALAHVLQNH